MSNKVICSLLLVAASSLSTKVLAGDLTNDPYARVEHLKYNNGLEVFLAPSETATTANIEIVVATGTEAETKTNRGVSHLLEHVLFRDKGTKDEMTYLQLIKEAGGSANGGTGERETKYYGTTFTKVDVAF